MRPERLDEARVQLRLGEQPGRGVQQRPAQVEVVRRELEVEEGGLGLLELARHGQHVVGEPRGLGEGDVDDDEQVEGGERLAHARAVGEGVGRVGGLDQHRAEALRMVAEDLVGDHVARHIPPMIREPVTGLVRRASPPSPPLARGWIEAGT